MHPGAGGPLAGVWRVLSPWTTRCSDSQRLPPPRAPWGGVGLGHSGIMENRSASGFSLPLGTWRACVCSPWRPVATSRLSSPLASGHPAYRVTLGILFSKGRGRGHAVTELAQLLGTEEPQVASGIPTQSSYLPPESDHVFSGRRSFRPARFANVVWSPLRGHRAGHGHFCKTQHSEHLYPETRELGELRCVQEASPAGIYLPPNFQSTCLSAAACVQAPLVHPAPPPTVVV